MFRNPLQAVAQTKTRRHYSIDDLKKYCEKKKGGDKKNENDTFYPF